MHTCTCFYKHSHIIWDNISLDIARKLENINIEAARIVSGATKLASAERLLEEVGWGTLSTRRKNHKITQYHKMVYGLTPSYLTIHVLLYILYCTLLPPKHNEIRQYPTRLGHYYSDIKCHTNHNMNSFLLSTTRL